MLSSKSEITPLMRSVPAVRDPGLPPSRRRTARALALSLLLFASAGAAYAQPKPAPAPKEASRSQIQDGIVAAAAGLKNHPKLKDLSDQDRVKFVEFVLGNTLYVLAHEAGHAVISEMALPVLGKEEDAADSFAALTALRSGRAFGDNVLINSARGWFYIDKRDAKDGVKMVFYDEHGINTQRAYNIICLMVGGEPEKFTAVADEAKMPKERQGTCQGDHSNASWSWEKVLKPHIRAAKAKTTKIKVTYGPGNGEYDVYAKVFQSVKMLEVVAGALSDRFVWRAPISLEMKACGSPNAEWNIPAKTITVCYEIASEFAALYAANR